MRQGLAMDGEPPAQKAESNEFGLGIAAARAVPQSFARFTKSAIRREQRL
jgi:hypothetical protein